MQYHIGKDTAFDTKGMSNPMVITSSHGEEFVIRAYGCRTFHLQIRPKLDTDTSEAISDMANEKNYVDDSNRRLYKTVMSFCDY